MFRETASFMEPFYSLRRQLEKKMFHLGIPILPAIIECQERNLNHVRSLREGSSSSSSSNGDGMVFGSGQVGLILNVSVCRFGEMSTFNRLARLLNRSSMVSVTLPFQICFVDDSKGRSLLLSPELVRKSDSSLVTAIAAAGGDNAIDMVHASSSSSSSSMDMPLLLNTSTKSGPIVNSMEATTVPMSIDMEPITSTHQQQSERSLDRRGNRALTTKDPSNTGTGGSTLPIARASRAKKDQPIEAPTVKALVRLILLAMTPYITPLYLT